MAFCDEKFASVVDFKPKDCLQDYPTFGAHAAPKQGSKCGLQPRYHPRATEIWRRSFIKKISNREEFLAGQRYSIKTPIKEKHP